jgi:hypothetical protein
MRESTQPRHWGKDKLSEFLQLANQNRLATFELKKAEWNRLSEIDDCFQTTIEHLINCEPHISVFLFLRAHAAYRATCSLAMAGQVVETYPLCRLVLENGLYAFHIYKNPKAEATWVHRDDDPSTLRAAKREFTYGNVRQTLESSDPRLAKIASSLYERSISYGAHPNEAGVTGSLKVLENEKHVELQQNYLHGDSEQLELALKSTAQCGLFPLKLAQIMWDFRVQFSGVSQRIDKLEKDNL